jgi:hypothetical protein
VFGVTKEGFLFLSPMFNARAVNRFDSYLKPVFNPTNYVEFRQQDDRNGNVNQIYIMQTSLPKITSDGLLVHTNNGYPIKGEGYFSYEFKNFGFDVEALSRFLRNP